MRGATFRFSYSLNSKHKIIVCLHHICSTFKFTTYKQFIQLMIQGLPLEIQVKLLRLVPTSELKHVNSHFYILYNDLYYAKIIETFGDDILGVLLKILPWLKEYVKSLDVFRKQSRQLIASRLKLTSTASNDLNPLHCIYIKDSWKYIYSILKNKRLFAEYSDYKIDEPSNYVYNHFVEINRTYLLSYRKSLWLAPGTYNLNIGLVVKHGSGLGTTKFEVKFENELTEPTVQTFYPQTNINEILPKKQFCLLKLGEINLPKWSKHRKLNGGPGYHNKLYRVELVMEEIGLYLKSGFRIFFIDISQPSVLFNDYDLLYYTANQADYRYFINIPLKNLYKALNHVQNGGASDNLSFQNALKLYGEGDPNLILDQFDKTFLSDYTIEDEYSNDKNNYSQDSLYDEKSLMKYADFYFNNEFRSIYFKFQTVYQKRQFINKFGDFEIDYKNSVSQERDKQKYERACSYDKDGLKWKIPVLGEI
ncbi:uncharacterized protein RJT21DRAFT_122784 [Scheffersomyces amazonensis]|uniref:uncharacterized protein n=1 Tax=Scheffersomyces amazonensis TaxID=1078765 RepID=UPI00315CBD5C